MGMPSDLKRILSIARKYNVPVVEDAACALGSEIKVNKSWERIGKPHGDVACFSFHPRKIITTGEGGMITAKTSSSDKLIKVLRNQGVGIASNKQKKTYL